MTTCTARLTTHLQGEVLLASNDCAASSEVHLLICLPTVPPRIIENATVRAKYGNEPATFTVRFLSSFESNTTVTWNFNSLPLSRQELVRTEYENETAGSTSLHFTQLTRRDKGVYTVIIDNNMTLLPLENSARTDFIIRVEGKANR